MMQWVVAGVAPTRIPPRVQNFAPRVIPRRQRGHSICRVTFPDALSDSSDFFSDESFSEEDFLREFDMALNSSSFKFKPGQIVDGLIVDVDGSGVYVDYGGKEMGFCSAECLGIKKVPKPTTVIKPNSRHQFEIRQTGVNSRRLGGEITLLHRGSVLRNIAFKRLHQLSEHQIVFSVKVIDKNGGGYIVEDNMGMEGFLPASQAFLNPTMTAASPEQIVGNKIDVKVLDLMEDKNRIVVTQRGVLDERTDTSKFKIGNVVEGTVERVMPYGVFVNCGGLSGLLHESQITGGHVQSVDSVFNVKDRIKALVIAYDRSRGRLTLSTRSLETTAGDMLKNPRLVYEQAEEAAAKFRKQLETAEARAKAAEGDLIQPDALLDTSRLQARPAP